MALQIHANSLVYCGGVSDYLAVLTTHTEEAVWGKKST